jgi:hypothetical protein
MNFDLPGATAVLERTPGVLRSLLSGLPERWTRPNEGPETWSPFDVVGHLIDGEETDWMPRARRILQPAPGASRRFEPYDRFRHLTVNAGKPLAELLDRFARLRAANLAELSGLALGPEALRLTGEHPTFGAVTLEQLLATWVTHDLAHLAQIARVLTRHYGQFAGPWKRYFSLLR